MSALHHHGLYIYIYIYDCCRLPLGNMPLKCWLMHFRVARRLKHPLYRISKNSTSLFVHYCKGIVLEYLRGLVDFIEKLNETERRLTKLQHFDVHEKCCSLVSAPLCFSFRFN